MNKGIAGSAGYGVGKVVIISDAKPEYENRTITDTDAEIKRYDDAVAAFTEKTHAMAEAMKRVSESIMPRYLRDTYCSSQIRGWMRSQRARL